MNTGYECNKCHSRQVDAHLLKYSTVGLVLILRCRKCQATEEDYLDSYGYELFEPIYNEAKQK